MIFPFYSFKFLFVLSACPDPYPLCIMLEANKNLRNNNKSKKTKYNKIKSKQTPAREAGRLFANLDLCLYCPKLITQSHPTLQQNICFISGIPQIFPSKLSFPCQLLYPSLQLQQVLLGKPQAMLPREASKLTADLHLSFHSSKYKY